MSTARRLLQVCVLLAGSGGLVQSALAQCQEFQLTAADGEYGDAFGGAVAEDGQLAVIGAPQLNTATIPPGEVYIFRGTGTGWIQEARILPSSPAPRDKFGIDVDIDGERVVVGSPYTGNDGLPGAAYVFLRVGTDWVEEAQLAPIQPEADARFGYAVAISGDRVLVGAYNAHNTCYPLGCATGAAYVFRRDPGGWVQEAELLPTETDGDDRFGLGVALEGDYAVVIALDPDDGGAVYVFHREIDGWMMQAKITVTDPGVIDFFGNSVALSGERFVVGGILDSTIEPSGAAYVFKRTGGVWVQEARLLSDNGIGGNDGFGSALAMHGDNIVAGPGGYLFRRTGSTWSRVARLGSGGGRSPFDVAVTGEDVLFGDMDGPPGSNTGRTFAYSLPACLGIPALSDWGMAAMTLLVLSAGTAILMPRRRARRV